MKSFSILGALLLATQYVQAAPTAETPDNLLPNGCKNGGVQWAYYKDTAASSSAADDKSYDPTALKKRAPLDKGVTLHLDYNKVFGLDQPVYGHKARPSSDFALNHRGYLVAPESGKYTFNATATDDVSFLWFGDQARAGWTKGNDQLSVAFDYNTFQPGRGSYTTQELVQGFWYPFRIVYKQGGSAAAFDYSITSPSGKLLIGSNPKDKTSPYIVQYSCDGVLGPKFPPFGKEV